MTALDLWQGIHFFILTFFFLFRTHLFNLKKIQLIGAKLLCKLWYRWCSNVTKKENAGGIGFLHWRNIVGNGELLKVVEQGSDLEL